MKINKNTKIIVIIENFVGNLESTYNININI